jgi:hypothetical protein
MHGEHWQKSTASFAGKTINLYALIKPAFDIQIKTLNWPAMYAYEKSKVSFTKSTLYKKHIMSLQTPIVPKRIARLH